MASFLRISASDKLRQEERLTAKHVKTLQLTQSLSEDNKRLQARVAELEEQSRLASEVDGRCGSQLKRMEEDCLERIDRITDELVAKHNQEVTQLLHTKLESERSSQEDITQLYKRLKELEGSYCELKTTCESNSDTHEMHREALEGLRHELTVSQSTICKLEEKNHVLERDCRIRIAMKEQTASAEKDAKNVYAEEIAQLRSALHNCRKKLTVTKKTEDDLASLGEEHKSCVSLINELKEALAVKEWELNLKPVEQSVSAGDKASEEKCLNLSRELQKALKEKAILEEMVKAKKSDLEAMQSDLNSLQQDLNFLRGENVQLKGKMEQQTKELNELKAKSTRSQEFSEFVQLKREILALREQTMRLEEKTKRKSEAKLLSKRANIQLDALPLSTGSRGYSRVLSVTSTPSLPKLQTAQQSGSTGASAAANSRSGLKQV